MSLAPFLAKHLVFLVVTMLVVSFLVFALNEYSPGDVARKLLGQFATQEQVDLLTAQLGLNRPLLTRYVEYLGKLVTGDLGQSLRFKVPVREILEDRLKNTALLAAICFILIVPLSMLFGIIAGKREGSPARPRRPSLRHARRVGAGVRHGGLPASIFVVWLGLLPGTATLVAGGGWSIASQFVLPVAVVVLYDMGYVVNMVRASMVEVMQRPYIRTAVLKGLDARRVVLRHAVRNAMINPVTIIFLQLGYLIAGLVVVETIFAYPGFGRMMLEAALFKDIAVLEVGALVAVFVTVMTQILADLSYMVLDPRIRT